MKYKMIIIIITIILCLNFYVNSKATPSAVITNKHKFVNKKAILHSEIRLDNNRHQKELIINEQDSVTNSNVNKKSNVSTTILSDRSDSNNQYSQNVNENKDKIIFPNDDTMDSYSNEEKKCFSENHVYYNGSCQNLLERGICEEGHWLILDLKSTLLTPPKIIPKCQKQNCKYFQFYWPKTKTCFNISEINNDLCPSGNEIQTDFFGYGACKCKPAYGKYFNGSCFKLYTQGPCSYGHLLIENNTETTCMKNPCQNLTLVPWKNEEKQCYTLGEQGPCENNSNLQVSEITKKPECISFIEFQTVVGGPSTCNINGNKWCPPEFKVKEQGKEYIERIISQSKNRIR